MAVCEIDTIDAGSAYNGAARLTADGKQYGIASWTASTDPCCDLVECVDPCRLACMFVSLLPSGPMWDTPKKLAIEYITRNECTDPIELPQECAGLVAHAIYKAQLLNELVNSAVWVGHREADPFTAVSNLDSWLERLGWFDCYRTTCRSVMLGSLTALEVMGECGPVYCEIDYGADLECAVKRGIVASLTRVNMGFIDNLAGINWVLEPLGAVLRPYYPNGEGEAADCCDVQFELCNSRDTLAACDASVDACFDQRQKSFVNAWYTIPCEDLPMGMPEILWPGIIAAECIVRSILMKSCPNIVRVCCLSASEE